MKTILTTALILCTASAFAAKASKEDRGDKKALRAAMEALRPLDTNKDRKIEGSEVEALNKALAAAPSGPLAALDKNKDGKIDADELKAVNARAALMEALKEADADHNHKIEGAEVEALRKKFTADPKAFGRVDQNNNLKLDDDEIAKLNERMAEQGQRAGGKTKGKGKKGASTPTPAPATPATEAPKPESKGEEVKKPETPASQA